MASLHIQDAFSDPERTKVVFGHIGKHRPDVAFFAEAWFEGQDTLVDSIREDFTALGYQTAFALYDDDDGRTDRHGMMAIVRNRVLTDRLPKVVRLGSRNALYVPFAGDGDNQTTDIYFAHLDDRNEQRRLGQIGVLLDDIVDPNRPTIVGGKFNAFYPYDPLAVALRLQRPLTSRLPAVGPGPESDPTRLERFASLGQRLGSMATGAVMRRMTAARFKDADPWHRPTKGPFNLDRIMYRGLHTPVRRLKNRRLFKDQRIVTAIF